jgi:hypothetical protein
LPAAIERATSCESACSCAMDGFSGTRRPHLRSARAGQTVEPGLSGIGENCRFFRRPKGAISPGSEPTDKSESSSPLSLAFAGRGWLTPLNWPPISVGATYSPGHEPARVSAVRPTSTPTRAPARRTVDRDPLRRICNFRLDFRQPTEQLELGSRM